MAATLGRQANFWVITTEIDRLISVFPSDAPLASTLAVILMTLTAGVFLLQQQAQRRARFIYSSRVTGLTRLDLGRWRWPATLALLAVGFVATLVPWLAVLGASLLRAQSGAFTGANLTLQRYAVLFSGSQPQASLSTSVLLAVVAATVASVLGLGVAYFNLRLKLRSARFLDGVSLLPSAVPAIVIALALVTVWSISGVPDPIYKSPFILVTAYTILYLPLAVRYSGTGLVSHPSTQDYAARCCGAGGLTTVWRILLPALRPWLLGTWLTIFAISMRELVASLIVRPAGMTTTAVYIFERFEQGDMGQGMAMAVVTLVVTVVVLGAASRFGTGPGEQAVF